MIYIAGDHYTTDVMQKIEDFLSSKGVEFTNVGAIDSEVKVALQEIIPATTKPIQNNDAQSGILVCGTGAGVEIGANRFKGIQATLCTSAKQAEYARVYDNANVLCLSSWLTEDPTDILSSWLEHEFDGDEGRTKMIKDFDEWN